ncbi:MAG: S41 family peptidase, partial [Romboutsia sp.]|uniref:S41 family peptidase n=1 Tax=Romboutsia sp. TaxID=1965302 RepID=UPI003F2CC44F
SENKKEMKTSIVPERESEVYWYKNFEEDNILFLKYSGFTSRSSGEKYHNFYRFQDALIKEINESNYDKLVIDLRDNKGGSLHILTSMIEMFKYSAKVDGENIYVVTSKITGSAAVTLAWNLQSEIGATIAGESTGGNINLFSTRNDQLELPNSKLKPVYSHKFINNKYGYNGGVEPDIEIMQSYEDYIEGIDTCYEYIKNN